MNKNNKNKVELIAENFLELIDSIAEIKQSLLGMKAISELAQRTDFDSLPTNLWGDTWQSVSILLESTFQQVLAFQNLLRDIRDKKLFYLVAKREVLEYE